MTIPSTCPVCGSGDVRPLDDAHGAWFCGSCRACALRIYSLSRHAWWCEAALGYTGCREEAGLFSPLEAARHVAVSGDSVACAVNFDPERFVATTRKRKL